jgi:hypothetical protein
MQALMILKVNSITVTLCQEPGIIDDRSRLGCFDHDKDVRDKVRHGTQPPCQNLQATPFSHVFIDIRGYWIAITLYSLYGPGGTELAFSSMTRCFV